MTWATRVECPPELLPEGASAASFDPDTLEALAKRANRSPYMHEITTKAWVVLWLLDRWRRGSDLDALEASALRSYRDAYGPPQSDMERLYVQRGINVMRLAAAKAAAP